MSAGGSLAISGASRWLAALAGDGPGPRRSMSRASAAPNSTSPITASLRLSRTAVMYASLPLPGSSLTGLIRPRRRTGSDLNSDARARAAFERVGEGCGRRDQGLVARGPYELGARLDLGPHRARGELGPQRLGLLGREQSQLFLSAGS